MRSEESKVRRLPVALPGAHFMAFAPLDVWARLLLRARLAVPARYWLRLLAGLFTSTIGTVLTLPERLLLAPVIRWRFRGRARLEHGPGVVFVLGYYRSGTTHLHNLLSCDPRCFTPRWHQVIAPQGWLVSWTALRWMLIPFLPNKRPQDDVAFGPDWPAEDDFALSNWALASGLPGRFVTPARRAHYRRFHALEGLTSRELGRWRRYQAAFLWKIGFVARRRAILLKTPSHTARLEELIELLGRERVRFVHIAREPGDVVRSNVSMHRRLEIYNLQPGPDASTVREEVAREYLDTEERFCEQAARLGLDADGRLAHVRFQDLASDPVGEVERVYAALGLEVTPAFRERLGRYVAAVSGYLPANARSRDGSEAVCADEEAARGLEGLRERFGLEGPGRAPAGGAGVSGEEVRGRRVAPWAAAPVAAAVGFGLWMLAAYLTDKRLDSMVWPLGALVGVATIRAARVGTWRLGAWAAACTVLAVLASVYPLPEISSGWVGEHRWRSVRTAYGSLNNNYLWPVLGALTAYRFASRRHIRPPGR